MPLPMQSSRQFHHEFSHTVRKRSPPPTRPLPRRVPGGVGLGDGEIRAAAEHVHRTAGPLPRTTIPNPRATSECILRSERCTTHNAKTHGRCWEELAWQRRKLMPRQSPTKMPMFRLRRNEETEGEGWRGEGPGRVAPGHGGVEPPREGGGGGRQDPRRPPAVPCTPPWDLVRGIHRLCGRRLIASPTCGCGGGVPKGRGRGSPTCGSGCRTLPPPPSGPRRDGGMGGGGGGGSSVTNGMGDPNSSEI